MVRYLLISSDSQLISSVENEHENMRSVVTGCEVGSSLGNCFESAVMRILLQGFTTVFLEVGGCF